MSEQQLGLSAILATHGGDSPVILARAIESLVTQSRLPDEIVIVYDAGLPEEHHSAVQSAVGDSPVTITMIEQPADDGRGAARAKGVRAAQMPVVAILDSDDVCLPNRFEKQLQYLETHPDVAAVGGYIEEFDSDPSDPQSVREVPTDSKSIRKKARFRCPMNHQTVAARREAILTAGNYRDIPYGEDYDLWVRLLANGETLGNIPTVLTKAQAGESLMERRGGIAIARREVELQMAFVQYGFISAPLAMVNLLARLPLRVLPTRLRSKIYSTVLRQNV